MSQAPPASTTRAAARLGRRRRRAKRSSERPREPPQVVPEDSPRLAPWWWSSTASASRSRSRLTRVYLARSLSGRSCPIDLPTLLQIVVAVAAQARKRTFSHRTRRLCCGDRARCACGPTPPRRSRSRRRTSMMSHLATHRQRHWQRQRHRCPTIRDSPNLSVARPRRHSPRRGW